MSEIANQPLLFSIEDKEVLVKFETLAPLAGMIWGVFKTDDAKLQMELDKVVGTRGLKASTQKEYDELKKKVVPPFSDRASPRPFSMSQPSPAATSEPEPAAAKPAVAEVSLEELSKGQPENLPAVEPAPKPPANKKAKPSAPKSSE